MTLSGLNIVGVAADELAELLLQHFGHSHNFEPRKILFRNANGEACLSISYNKKWEISSVKIEEGLPPDGIEQLNEDIDCQLRRSDGEYIFREFLFYTVGVNCAFRHRDIFQFFPVPEDAAKPETILGLQPFVLEVAVPASPNVFTSANRGRRKAESSARLLSVLLNFTVSKLPKNTTHRWIYNEPGSIPPVSYRQVGYTCFDPKWESVKFSDIGPFAPAQVLEVDTYYAVYGIRGGEQLTLPANIENQLDKFFHLSVEDRARFERACYWYVHAFEVRAISKSASYIALVSAIECMLEGPIKETPCAACGKMPTDGPTKQFRDFVEKQVPGAGEIKSLKQDLYGLRSRLAHGSRLLAADDGGWYDPRNNDEDEKHRQLSRLVQYALVNWLSMSATGER